MALFIDYDRFARLYDDIVVVRTDVPFFLRVAAQTRGRVLDLMTGTGRVALPLIGDGVRLTAVDLSAAMLALFRRKLSAQSLEAPLVRADVERLPFAAGSFSLALLPFNSFSELLGDAVQRRALRSIRRVLQPSGRFICTLHNPPVRLRQVSPKLTTWGRCPRSDSPGEVILRIRSTFDEKSRVVDGMQIFEELDADGKRVRETAVPLRFTLHTGEAFRSMAEEVGFTVEELWGDYDGSRFDPIHSPFLIWDLRKA